MRQIKAVSFFGFSDAKPIDKIFQDAYKTAKLLAENGYVIVNGGGPGVMEAATSRCKGADDYNYFLS
jgi:predicted Rossmann-fold nucleotide-binding protein